jgi:hypothetical protein
MELGKVVQAIVDRKSNNSESMIVANHLTQMVMFMCHQGLEFVTPQDSPTSDRSKFITKTLADNRLDMYYRGIATLFVATGGILWFIQPTLQGYSIYWFHSGSENNSIEDVKSQYKCIYTPNGRELKEVIVRYEYYDTSSNPLMNTMGGPNQAKKWVRLRITDATIIQEFFGAEPILDVYGTGAATVGMQSSPVSTNTYLNTMGFIPCVESCNNPLFPGDSGRSDFVAVTEQVEAEDTIRGRILANINMFGNPTLLTSRDSSEVLAKMSDNQSQTWAARQGFADSSSTRLDGRRNDGGWAGKQQREVKQIIGNVGADERFGYVFPDPVSPDQSRFADEYRSAVHSALGGIDPSDKNFATFGEYKSLYGKVAATAQWKSIVLWRHGLGKCLEFAVKHEESLYIEGFKGWLITQNPKIIIEEVTQGQIEQLVWQDNINPPSIPGLKPYGQILVDYRHKGDVFEDSPQDKLQRTIYTRNLQELGVGSLEALDAIFPNLSTKEKKAKLSGIPFRIGSEYLGLFNNLLQQHMQLMQVEDPFAPGNALSLRYNLIGLMDSIFNVLQREFSYGSSYDDADTLETIANGSTTISIPGQPTGNPISSSSDPNTGNPSVSTSTSTGQPLPFDWANPSILPNSTISTTSQQRWMGQSSGPYGSPTNDLGSRQLWVPPRTNFNTINTPVQQAVQPTVQPTVRPKRSNRKKR